MLYLLHACVRKGNGRDRQREVRKSKCMKWAIERFSMSWGFQLHSPCALIDLNCLSFSYFTILFFLQHSQTFRRQLTLTSATCHISLRLLGYKRFNYALIEYSLFFLTLPSSSLNPFICHEWICKRHLSDTKLIIGQLAEAVEGQAAGRHSISGIKRRICPEKMLTVCIQWGIVACCRHIIIKITCNQVQTSKTRKLEQARHTQPHTHTHAYTHTCA